MDLLRTNYLSFFMIYLIISLINTFIILYIPFFMLEILNVNRIQLSFVQFLSYLTLFLGPITGLFFDKFSHKKKQLMLVSSLILIISFSFFNLNINNLSYFGIFLSLNFTSRLIIKAGMAKLMLEASQFRNAKKNIILISNVSASIGSIIPIMLFNLVVYDINSIDLWTSFFNICWFMSFPIMLTFFLIKDNSLSKNFITETKITEPLVKKKLKNKHLSLILILLANFLIWGDKLIEFPLTSYIFTKFGEEGFRNYSYLFFIFLYLNIGGWFIARRLKNKKKSCINISISITIYASLMFFIVFSNLTTFLLIMAANQLVGGIMMSQFTERNIDVSNLSKNTALSYELIRGSSLLANLIFVPLGTLLSTFVPLEFLITIVVVMSLFSITPLYFLKKC